MKLKDFSKLYAVLLLLHIVTIYRPSTDNVLFLFSKPLLMFSLLSFFLHKVGHINLRAKFVYVGALLFSLAGDVFLMFTEQAWFLYGVGAFLLAQISYTIFFATHSKRFNWRSLFLSVVPIGIGFYFLNVVLTVPVNLQVPLNVYAVSLAAMVISALNYGLEQGKRLIFIQIGAFSFLFSDLLLAYQKFELSTVYTEVGVMFTYAIAQFLLATTVIALAEKEYHQI